MVTTAQSLCLPLEREQVRELEAGQRLLLHGSLFTARDAAHRRLLQCLDSDQDLPFPLAGQIIYYCGPCPSPPGWAVGSAGPTTSSRMDPFLEPLLARGLQGTIGKGPRSPRAVEAMVSYGAVYLLATGGAGALLATRIRSSQVVAFPELGPEAVHRLEVWKFPVLVAVDSQGRNLFARDMCRAGEGNNP